MKTFSKWCEDTGHDLKSIIEILPSEKPTSESGAGKRQCIRNHELPPQAGRGNYPANYFAPSVSDRGAYQKDKE